MCLVDLHELFAALDPAKLSASLAKDRPTDWQVIRNELLKYLHHKDMDVATDAAMRFRGAYPLRSMQAAIDAGLAAVKVVKS